MNEAYSILVLANSLPGLFSFRIELMQRLIEKGMRVTICAPAYQDYDERLKDLNIDFHAIDIDRRGVNPLKDLNLILKYKQLIRDANPDAILSYTIKPNIYGGIAAALCNVPQIANITGLGSAVENPGILQKITTFLYKIGFRKTNVVFFKTKATKIFSKI